MSFDWRAYHELAQVLNGDTDAVVSAEAGYRTACSRAYYAAHNESLLYVQKTLWLKVDAHNALINFFLTHSDKQFIKLGETLRRLKQRREYADYYETIPRNDWNWKKETSKAVADTSAIFSILDTLQE